MDYIQTIAQGIPKDLEPIIAKVLTTKPLTIQIDNNKKLNPSEKNILVLQNLTDYTLKADIVKGEITSETSLTSIDTHGKHLHNLDNFTLKDCEITLKNALSKGDMVFGFYYKGKYILIDKVVK